MKKIKMFENYEKMFWGLLKFIVILLLGICGTSWGFTIVIGFVLGVIFAYIVMRSWTVEEEQVVVT